MTAIGGRYPGGSANGQRDLGALLPRAAAGGCAVLGGLVIGTAGHPLRLVALIAVITAVVFALTRSWGLVLVLSPSLLTTRTALVGPFDPDLVLGLVSLALLLAYALVNRLDLRPSWPVLTIGGLVTLVSLGTTLGGTEKLQPGLSASVVAITGLLLGLLMARYPDRRKAFALAGVGVAALALLETAVGRHLWPASLNGHVLTGTQEGWRSMSTLGHPLVAGGVMSVLAVLVATTPNLRWRVPLTAFLVAGAVTTVSRSSALALLMAAAVGIALNSRGRARAAAIVVVGSGVLLLAISMSPTLASSYGGRVLNSREQQNVRGAAAAEAVSILQTDPWAVAVGGGTGASGTMLRAEGGVDGYYIFDNQYVTLLFDVGWLSLLTIGTTAAFFIVRAGRIAALASLPALAAVLVLGAFTDSLTWLSLAILSWTVLGLAMTRQADPAEAEPATTG